MVIEAAREQAWIDCTIGILNASGRAGSGPKPGHIASPESRAKMSAALTGKKKSPEHRAAISASRTGVPNPKHGDAIRGRKASLETRLKMSASHRGKVRSETWRQNLSVALTGRVRSAAHAEHIATAKRGQPWSAARRAAHRPPTPRQLESIARVSQANVGSQWSPERREKLDRSRRDASSKEIALTGSMVQNVNPSPLKNHGKRPINF